MTPVGMWVMRMADSLFVDVLAARAAGAVGVDLQVGGVDLDVVVVVDLGHHLQRGKGGLAAAGGVKRRDAHQPVDAVLRLQKAVGVGAGDEDRRALDARFLPGQIVQHLDLEVVALRPAGVHAVEHLHPVLGLGAARARVEGQDGVVGVKLPGQ